MYPTFPLFAFFLSTLIPTNSASPPAFEDFSLSSQRPVTADVIILGGGAAGTYAAIALRTTYNKSVIVIEPKSRLGGHVDTWTDPESNITIDYGVQSYTRYGPSESFFKQLGVEIAGPYNPRRSTGINVDLTTGKVLQNYIPPTTAEVNQALAKWIELVEQYESRFNPGLWSFFPTGQIPSELLIPFGEFAKKHGIEAAGPRLAAVSGAGVGGLGKLLTADVVRNFGSTVARGLVEGTQFVPKGSNSALYQRAYEILKDDVFLEQRAVLAKRDDGRIRLSIEDKYGERKLLVGKRLLVAAQPSIGNLAGIDLDEKEKAVFSEWSPIYSFVGVVKASCIPENYSLAFIDPAAVPNKHLSVRNSPWTLRFDATGPFGKGYFRLLFSANYNITPREVKKKAQEELQKVQDAGSLNSTGKCEIEWKAFGDHRSIGWSQDAERLQGGFVQRIQGLQGYKGTWYTGGLWTGIYSSNVWAMTEKLLPKLLEGI